MFVAVLPHRIWQPTGLPTYNDAREDYGFSRVTSFADITADITMQELLSDAYGDLNDLDAYTGAIAETEEGSALFAGPLLRVRVDQAGTLMPPASVSADGVLIALSPNHHGKEWCMDQAR